jgi:hypothetical protein
MTRVTSGELFGLTDSILKLSRRASGLSQHGVLGPLDEALAKVLDAAKSAAFNEAHERHKMTAPPEEK